MIKVQLYLAFAIVLRKALVEMKEHLQILYILSLELKGDGGNNAFESSVGINELSSDL